MSKNSICIAIDGTDRTGKSTAIKSLVAQFESDGYKVFEFFGAEVGLAKSAFKEFYKKSDTRQVYDIIGASQLTTFATSMIFLKDAYEKTCFIFDRLFVSSFVNGTVLRQRSFYEVWEGNAYLEYVSSFVKTLSNSGIEFKNYVAVRIPQQYTNWVDDDDNELQTIDARNMRLLNDGYVNASMLDFTCKLEYIPVITNDDFEFCDSVLADLQEEGLLPTVDKSWVDARTLLTEHRYDLLLKLAYIEAVESNDSALQKKYLNAYIDHIQVFNGGNEPNDDSKNTIFDFINAFNKIIDDVKNDKFDWAASPIPVDNSDRINKIVNGAHRTAAAIYYNKKVKLSKGIGKGIDGVRHVYVDGIMSGCSLATKEVAKEIAEKYNVKILTSKLKSNASDKFFKN